MTKNSLYWLLSFTSILCSAILFIALYVWISMSSNLAVYAGYAGSMQAVSDYEKGNFGFYKKTNGGDDHISADVEGKPVKIQEYSVQFFDIAGKYGMQNYVDAYNSKMKQLYEEELKGSDTFSDDSGKDEHCRQQRRQ